MQQVVIDTNVLVSAALRGGIPAKVIHWIVDSDQFSWVASPEIRDEYLEVLGRPKFKFPDADRKFWLNHVQLRTKLIDLPFVPIELARDPADSKFLTLAIGLGASYLITGDRDFESVLELGPTKIISARNFARVFIDAEA